MLIARSPRDRRGARRRGGGRRSARQRGKADSVIPRSRRFGVLALGETRRFRDHRRLARLLARMLAVSASSSAERSGSVSGLKLISRASSRLRFGARISPTKVQRSNGPHLCAPHLCARARGASNGTAFSREFRPQAAPNAPIAHSYATSAMHALSTATPHLS
jgi:hypothetical protein